MASLPFVRTPTRGVRDEFRLAALVRAWRASFGCGLAEDAARDLAAVDWSAADTRGAALLTRRLLGRSGHDPAPRLGKDYVSTMGMKLALTVARLAADGVPREEAFSWVEAHLADPHPQTMSVRLATLHRDGVAAGVPVAEWSWRVGPLGPLAWAAGMHIEEAAARAEAGTLREDTLRTMVGLRGWRLPT